MSTEKRICSSCGEEQFGDNRINCVSCGYVFPKNETVTVTTEFSCIKCKKLWVGVFIAGLVTLAIFNLFMSFIDFGHSIMYDIIKLGIGFAIVIGLGIGTWFCMHEYCIEDKGNMTALTVGLILAIVTILILTYTIISISATATWFEFIESKKDINVLLNSNCEVFDMLRDNRYVFEYYDDRVSFHGQADQDLLLEKIREC